MLQDVVLVEAAVTSGVAMAVAVAQASSYRCSSSLEISICHWCRSRKKQRKEGRKERKEESKKKRKREKREGGRKKEGGREEKEERKKTDFSLCMFLYFSFANQVNVLPRKKVNNF